MCFQFIVATKINLDGTIIEYINLQNCFQDCVHFIASDEESTTYTIDITLKCPLHMQVMYCQRLLRFRELVIVT